MATIGKNWPKEAKDKLSAAYKKVDVPTDQLVQRPDKLEWITDLFNMSMALTEAEKLTTEAVLQKLISMRKNRQLPKLRMLGQQVKMTSHKV